MTAEFEHRSTVNKRYEPPSKEVVKAFDRLMFDDHGNARFFNHREAVSALVYLDSLDEHMVRALMYHARNGGLA